MSPRKFSSKKNNIAWENCCGGGGGRPPCATPGERIGAGWCVVRDGGGATGLVPVGFLAPDPDEEPPTAMRSDEEAALEGG